MNDISKGQLTEELLELGEMLFDTAIDAAVHPPAGEETPLIEEMRAAAAEFFTALRLLLK